ncbi:unnamed protein product [Protopolystoma xenopodis]|uniref:Uncharacterized protein n=1 Tax=Protopolystoma xenopodis TaxID=117903 RepID=A0A3S5CK42_9PLAT|nr:unnamed protein product [Protopolystoma xenopodis]
MIHTTRPPPACDIYEYHHWILFLRFYTQADFLQCRMKRHEATSVCTYQNGDPSLALPPSTSVTSLIRSSIPSKLGDVLSCCCRDSTGKTK